LDNDTCSLSRVLVVVNVANRLLIATDKAPTSSVWLWCREAIP